MTATTAVAAIATRGKKGSQRAVSVQTEKQGGDDGQAATAENIGAEEAVFRAENKQSDKDPKGDIITLGATIHKKTSCVLPQGICTSTFMLRYKAEIPAVLSF